VIETYLRQKAIGGRYVGKKGSEKTIRAYRAALQTAERYVSRPLDEWTIGDVDELIITFEEFDVSPAYRANILAALRGFFDWAIAMGHYTKVHPLTGVSSPRAPRTIPTILTEEQVRSFFACLHGKYKIFFELMYYGGLRIGEVTSLRREDVREDGIVVRGKGDKQRFVPLPSSLRNRLQTFMEEHNESSFVFYGESANAKKDAPITLIQARDVFNRTKDFCRLNIRPHNLRHTSATHFHAKVGDLAMTQSFLGHARPETTMIYAQIADSRMKKAAASVFGS